MSRKKLKPGQEQLVELMLVFAMAAVSLYALWAVLKFLREVGV